MKISRKKKTADDVEALAALLRTTETEEVRYPSDLRPGDIVLASVLDLHWFKVRVDDLDNAMTVLSDPGILGFGVVLSVNPDKEVIVLDHAQATGRRGCRLLSAKHAKHGYIHWSIKNHFVCTRIKTD